MSLEAQKSSSGSWPLRDCQHTCTEHHVVGGGGGGFHTDAERGRVVPATDSSGHAGNVGPALVKKKGNEAHITEDRVCDPV